MVATITSPLRKQPLIYGSEKPLQDLMAQLQPRRNQPDLELKGLKQYLHNDEIEIIGG